MNTIIIKKTESTLIILSIVFAILSSVFKSFHLEGSMYILLGFTLSSVILSLYYTFTSPIWLSKILQILLALSFIQFFFKINNYPQFFPLPLLNITLLLFPYFIIVSDRMIGIAGKDKNLIYSISANFFLFGILTLSPNETLVYIGLLFMFIYSALIIFYFLFRKEHSFFLDGFLKTVTVTSIGSLMILFVH